MYFYSLLLLVVVVVLVINIMNLLLTLCGFQLLTFGVI